MADIKLKYVHRKEFSLAIDGKEFLPEKLSIADIDIHIDARSVPVMTLKIELWDGLEIELPECAIVIEKTRLGEEDEDD